jgi:hypothetical protein
MQLLGYVAREREDALTGSLRDGTLFALLGRHLTGRDQGAQTAALSTLCDLAHHPLALLAMKQVGRLVLFFFPFALFSVLSLSWFVRALCGRAHHTVCMQAVLATKQARGRSSSLFVLFMFMFLSFS